MISRKTFLQSMLGLAGSSLLRRPARGGDPEPLRRNPLGRTGLTVTALGFGATRTMESALVKAALDCGLRFIDTGRSYANGKNEEMLGEALTGRRNEVVIQSKLRLPDAATAQTPAAEIIPRMEKDLEETLRALRTDRVDVLLLHGIEEVSILDHEGVKDFFGRAKKTGKIRACGFSAHKNHLILLEKTLRDGFYEVVMLPFNPFGGFRHSIGGWSTKWDQENLIKALERAQAAGIGVVAMKTCSGGPYTSREGENPSLAEAVHWVTEKPYIASAAVAMANFRQLEEHVGRHSL